MHTELLFRDKKIPVSFISSDQKAIPQLLSILHKNRTTPVEQSIERIEIIGNHAVLHSDQDEKRIEFPLY